MIPVLGRIRHRDFRRRLLAVIGGVATAVLGGGTALAAIHHTSTATSLALTAPTQATSNFPFSFTVTAKDSLNNTVTGYTGTVHFTSSDSGASLPADYTFTSGDAGVHTFWATLTVGVTGSTNLPATVSLTATDTVTSPITGTASVTVLPSQAHSYVMSLYQDILGRAGDAGGVNGLVSILHNDGSRWLVAGSLVFSNEYKVNLVTQDFQHLLHRAPDSSGLNGGVAFLQAGGTDEGVITIIGASPEYFTNAGGTNAGFVNAIYQSVLGRAPDSQAAQVFTNALNGGLLSRADVVWILTHNDEYRAIVIQAAYAATLDRAAESGGLAGWTVLLRAGLRDEDVLVGLAGSREDYVLAQNNNPS